MSLTQASGGKHPARRHTEHKPCGSLDQSFPSCLLGPSQHFSCCGSAPQEGASKHFAPGGSPINCSIGFRLKASESLVTGSLLVCSARSSSGSQKWVPKADWTSGSPEDPLRSVNLQLWGSTPEVLVQEVWDGAPQRSLMICLLWATLGHHKTKSSLREPPWSQQAQALT